MHTPLSDAITLKRQNVEIYTWAYHPCRLLPHRKDDDVFQTPHKLCVPTGSVRSPPEACVLLIQRGNMGFRKDQYLDLFYLPCTPTPLGNMIRNHGLDFHIYADDTQVYISFKPGDSVSRQTAKMSTFMVFATHSLNAYITL